MSTPAQSPGTRIHRVTCVLFQAFIIAASFSNRAGGQISPSISLLSHPDAFMGRPLVIQANVTESVPIERMYLLYRPFGESNFLSGEMSLVGNVATGRIPAEAILPPFVEYYLIIVHSTGYVETSPPGSASDPFSEAPPVLHRATIRDPSLYAKVLFLSPEPSSRVSPEELVISLSFLRVDSSVARERTELIMDDHDVSHAAVMSGDLMILVPSNTGMNLAPGPHTARVRLYAPDGTLHEESVLSFFVIGETRQQPQARGTDFRYGLSTQLESRHENVAGYSTWYNRASLRLNGDYGDWQLQGQMFVTSDEEAYRQPQNRFYAGIESSWLKVGFGDVFPFFPSLIMSGRRVRGLTGKLTLGPVSFEVVNGQTERPLEGSILKQFPLDSLAVEQQRDPTAAYGPVDAATWAKYAYGTFSRDLLALRLDTRMGDTWSLGLTTLKGKDDVGSISYGSRPQENLVAGVDFGGTFDNRRVEFTGQVAFSAYNSDISSGEFTDEYIDTTFKSNADKVRTVRDILGNFITVNDNLRPLSLDELATLAYEFSLGLSYFSNALKASYIYRGSDYFSFGHTYLRKDVRGVIASDRITLARNQVFISLGFEHLQDNTTHFKVATTTFRNYNAALTYSPRIQAPIVTVGFGRYTSNNGIPVTGRADSLSAIDDEDDRFYLNCSYNFEWEASHNAALSLSTSQRNDRSVRNFDVNATMVSARLLTRYSIPLQTGIDLSFNFNSLPAPGTAGTLETNYTTLSLSARYLLWSDRLAVEGRVSPTFGNFRRTVYDGTVAYAILPTMTLQLRMSLFANPATQDDTIMALTYRYDI
jgi:hypothetical protein